MKETTIFEKVSVEDEYPDFNGDVGVILSNKVIKETGYYDGDFIQVSPAVTHWLRERQAIVLSKEELIELLKEAFKHAHTKRAYNEWLKYNNL